MFQKAALGLIFFSLIVLITGGFSCQVSSQEAIKRSQGVALTYWGVDDTSGAFEKVIANYRAIHPNVSITYRKFRIDEYEQALIEAWASDRGPDIYMIPSTWLDRYLDKGYIQALPAKTSMPYTISKGGSCQKNDTIVIKEKTSLTLKDLKTNFVDVVSDDVVRNGKIYGLPYSIETLALFYNRDLLNNANIPNPPTNWDDFKNQVKKLTLQDETGKILQSGVAMGTANNIANSADILTLLMLQNGAVMASGNHSTFNSASSGDQKYFPGLEALKFYTYFANPTKEVYTWNSEQPEAFTAFATGKVGFYFGYPSDIALLKSQAPKLNFGVSEVPQISSTTKRANYANYWLNVVSFKTKHKNETWDFLQVATLADNAKEYLAKTNKPTALRNLISSQLNDLYQTPFAQQVLAAKSWYTGRDYPSVVDAFKSAISDINNGSSDYSKVLNNAANKINQTY